MDDGGLYTLQSILFAGLRLSQFIFPMNFKLCNLNIALLVLSKILFSKLVTNHFEIKNRFHIFTYFFIYTLILIFRLYKPW